MTVISPKPCARQRIGQWLIGIACLLGCSIILAQSSNADTSPPVIELEELIEGVADSSQVFTVQISEETRLRDATLYYRRSGQQPYTAASMSPLGTSGFYTVSIPTDPTNLLPIEYYIQARDSSGNRTVSGFAFDPYSRKLTQATASRRQPLTVDRATQADTNSPIAVAKPFYKRRWFQVTLGVVAVGVLASSLDSDGEDTRIVPVTIVLE